MSARALLWRSSARYLWQHWLQTALAVVGVALGVALVVGVDSANSAARRAFSLSVEGVSGKATHQLIPAGADGIPDSLYPLLRRQLADVPMAPVLQGYITLASDSTRTFQLLGIDPLAEQPFRPYLGETGQNFPFSQFLTQPGAVLLPAQLASELKLTLKDSLAIRHQGQPQRLFVLGQLQPADEAAAQAMAGLLVADISTAQEVLAQAGRLSHIDLILAPGDEARLQSLLPGGVLLERAEARTRRLDEMTAAFRLNLTALGLLALVVGVLLVYNTATFGVVQRTAYLGLLRAVGVTPQGAQWLVFREALAMGMAGSFLGLVLGWALAGALTQLVSRSINDLYFVVQVQQAGPDMWVFVKGLLVGMGATLVGTWVPARAAGRIQPRASWQRSQAEADFQAAQPRVWLLAGVLALLSALLLALSGRDLVLSYLGLLAAIGSFALLVPVAASLLAQLLGPIYRRLFGVLGLLAVRDLRANLSRTAVAMAALSIAVAATIGVTVMVASFRTTVVVWLQGALQSDIYLSAPSPVARRNDATLAPGIVDSVRLTPGVASIATIRSVLTSVQGQTAQLVALGGVDANDDRAEQRFLLADGGSNADAIQALQQGQVLISEPLAYKYDLERGDSLTLPTDRGPQAFRIAGVFYDYGSDLGIIYLGQRTYERFWNDRGTSGLGIQAAPGQSVDSLLTRIRQRTAPLGQQLLIRSNQSLLDTSLTVFDRTFAITGALRLLTVLVAFIGVFSALMALLLSRARDLAVLRALGLTPGQMLRLSLLNTSLMGLISGVLAIPAGLGLAAGLVYVINRRSFGWTLQFEADPAFLVQGLVLALVAALLAGLYPAWRMARAEPAAALREE